MQSLEPKHSLLQNVLAKGTLNIFNALLPLVIVPYVYRILGPAQMGDIEYANTINSYFGMLGLLGIYNYGLREISKNRNNPSEVRDIYKNLFTIGLLSNGICIAIYTTFIALFIQSPQLKIIGYILTANLVSQLFYVEWVNEAFEEFRFITIKTVVIRSLSLLAIFLFVKQASDAIIYVWIISGVCVANYAVSYWYAQRNIRLSLRETFSGLSLKKYIIPLFIILILNNTGILYTIADRIILGHYTGTESVAFFSIGQKIVEVVKTLLLSVVFATLPRLAFYLEGDKHLYQAGIIKLMRLVLATIIPAGIGMFMLSHDIIWLFGGEKYLSGVSARSHSIQSNHISPRKRKDTGVTQYSVRRTQRRTELSFSRLLESVHLDPLYIHIGNYFRNDLRSIYPLQTQNLGGYFQQGDPPICLPLPDIHSGYLAG